jgi:hypothetical protein
VFAEEWSINEQLQCILDLLVHYCVVSSPGGLYDYFTCACAGDVPGMQWLHKQGVPLTAATAAAAAGAGQLHVLHVLQAQGCCIDVSAAHAAARTGQLAVLRWMWEGSLQEGQQQQQQQDAWLNLESCCQVSS